MHSYVFSTLVFIGLVTTTSAVMSARVDEAPRLQVPVQGLTEANAPNVTRALKALESEGNPPHAKLLAEVVLDLDKGVMRLMLAEGHSLRLKQVERALNATGVRIRGERFDVGASLLVFEGEVGEGAVEKLQRALTTDLFAKAEVRLQGDPKQLVAQVMPGEAPATLDSVAKAARMVAPSLRIADIVWSRPKAGRP